MTEFSIGSRIEESVPQIIPDSSMPVCPPAATMCMPLDADSREAEALKGAMSFLYALIASYDELMAMGEAAASNENDPR
jgi:hypothetical protein